MSWPFLKANTHCTGPTSRYQVPASPRAAGAGATIGIAGAGIIGGGGYAYPTGVTCGCVGLKTGTGAPDTTGGAGGSQAAEDYNRDVYIPFKTSRRRFGDVIFTR
ncbi:MAG: hypothetical protein K2P78_09140, partial [Gemmataceae bacterium]|nr:hypothetical protein [Gemmataceae bacterium]